MFSSVLFVLSITALGCEWKTIVRGLSKWSNWDRLMKYFASKLGPWPEWRLSGQPKQCINYKRGFWLLLELTDWVPPLLEVIWWSPIRRLFWYPMEGGFGPKKSIRTVENGKLSCHTGVQWLWFFSGLLGCWQINQLATNTLTSRLWSGQKNR